MLDATEDFLPERHAIRSFQIVVFTHSFHHFANFGFQQDRSDSPKEDTIWDVLCAAKRSQVIGNLAFYNFRGNLFIFIASLQ